MAEELISIEKAFKILKLSGKSEDYIDVDDVKDDIAKGYLKAYRKLPVVYSMYPSMFPPISEKVNEDFQLKENVSNIMQVTGALRWIEDSLLSSIHIIFDKDGNEVFRRDVNFPDGNVKIQDVLLKREEVIAFRDGDKNKISEASNILFKQRTSECNTSERDQLVTAVMKRIEEERKRASKDCNLINHLRFISEMGIPKNLVSGVTNRVKKRIKEDYNDCYKALNRRPKANKLEPYFLTK